MNFGETLTYWYLRLNGFFPLQNFVLHRGAEDIKHTADSDILAVRLPYTYEEIGGQVGDWDEAQFRRWGINLQNCRIGLIVEVKTSPKIVHKDVERAFNPERLRYATQRLGFFPREQARRVADHLRDDQFHTVYIDGEPDTIVGKVLVANAPHEQVEGLGCLTLNLHDAANFIEARMKKYIDPKMAGRMSFPSDLLQYIIWKCRQPPATVTER